MPKISVSNILSDFKYISKPNPEKLITHNNKIYRIAIFPSDCYTICKISIQR